MDFLPVTAAQWQFISFETVGANGTFFITDNPPFGTTVRLSRAIIP